MMSFIDIYQKVKNKIKLPTKVVSTPFDLNDEFEEIIRMPKKIRNWNIFSTVLGSLMLGFLTYEIIFGIFKAGFDSIFSIVVALFFFIVGVLSLVEDRKKEITFNQEGVFLKSRLLRDKKILWEDVERLKCIDRHFLHVYSNESRIRVAVYNKCDLIMSVLYTMWNGKWFSK